MLAPPPTLSTVSTCSTFKVLCPGHRACMVVPLSLTWGLSNAIPFYGRNIWIGRVLGTTWLCVALDQMRRTKLLLYAFKTIN